MMSAFVSMLITMGMVSMVIIVAILVPKAFLFPGISDSISFLLLIDLGDESFKLSTIEPDTSTQLANIYGDTIPVLFFQSRFVASRTKHVNSFFI
jgi:hypothetical protein